MPSSVFPTMASSDDATIAARWALARSESLVDASEGASEFGGGSRSWFTSPGFSLVRGHLSRYTQFSFLAYGVQLGKPASFVPI